MREKEVRGKVYLINCTWTLFLDQLYARFRGHLREGSNYGAWLMSCRQIESSKFLIPRKIARPPALPDIRNYFPETFITFNAC